jgi:hypothetical protein
MDLNSWIALGTSLGTITIILLFIKLMAPEHNRKFADTAFSVSACIFLITVGLTFIFKGDEIGKLLNKPIQTTHVAKSTKLTNKSDAITDAVRDYQRKHSSETLTKFKADSQTITMPNNVTHVVFTNDDGKIVSGGNDLVSEAIDSNHAIYVFSK